MDDAGVVPTPVLGEIRLLQLLFGLSITSLEAAATEKKRGPAGCHHTKEMMKSRGVGEGDRDSLAASMASMTEP